MTHTNHGQLSIRTLLTMSQEIDDITDPTDQLRAAKNVLAGLYEALTVQTECALCGELNIICYDDGEAYCHVDHRRCEERQKRLNDAHSKMNEAFAKVGIRRGSDLLGRWRDVDEL